jgi:D-alanyl-D-alanine carboxypeptidase
MDFDHIAKKVHEQNRSPGFAFSICAGGEIAFSKGYGVADVATRLPVTADTRFAIGSLTKQFTAVMLLLLREQGKLSLEDRIESYVPEIPNGRQITLRTLLNQCSGLHNFPNTREHAWPREGIIPPDEIIAILKTDKPDFAPGERGAYSNTNYTLLAQVIAQVSGAAYGHCLKKMIFDPLGMDDTSNGFAAQSGTATPYEWVNNDFIPAHPTISLDLFHGAGSMVSTVEDLAHWNLALMGGRLLSSESLRELWTEGRLPDGRPTGYAMGFVSTMVGSHREVWHNGYSPRAGGYCFNAIFPDDRLAVVVLANASAQSFRGAPEEIVRDVLALYSS